MSNLFKYTKRVLTSVLAAAVVLTAIPSTAFGAEIDEDLAIEVQETEVAEAGEEVVVENEDALTTDGASGDEEIVVEEGEEDPDKSTGDVTLTFTNTKANSFVEVLNPDSLNGEVPYTFTSNKELIVWDSTQSLTLTAKPVAGYKIASDSDLTVKWTKDAKLGAGAHWTEVTKSSSGYGYTVASDGMSATITINSAVLGNYKENLDADPDNNQFLVAIADDTAAKDTYPVTVIGTNSIPVADRTVTFDTAKNIVLADYQKSGSPISGVKVYKGYVSAENPGTALTPGSGADYEYVASSKTVKLYADGINAGYAADKNLTIVVESEKFALSQATDPNGTVLAFAQNGNEITSGFSVDYDHDLMVSIKTRPEGNTTRSIKSAKAAITYDDDSTATVNLASSGTKLAKEVLKTADPKKATNVVITAVTQEDVVTSGSTVENATITGGANVDTGVAYTFTAKADTGYVFGENSIGYKLGTSETVTYLSLTNNNSYTIPATATKNKITIVAKATAQARDTKVLRTTNAAFTVTDRDTDTAITATTAAAADALATIGKPYYFKVAPVYAGDLIKSVTYSISGEGEFTAQETSTAGIYCIPASRAEGYITITVEGYSMVSVTVPANTKAVVYYNNVAQTANFKVRNDQDFNFTIKGASGDSDGTITINQVKYAVASGESKTQTLEDVATYSGTIKKEALTGAVTLSAKTKEAAKAGTFAVNYNVDSHSKYEEDKDGKVITPKNLLIACTDETTLTPVLTVGGSGVDLTSLTAADVVFATKSGSETVVKVKSDSTDPENPVITAKTQAKDALTYGYRLESGSGDNVNEVFYTGELALTVKPHYTVALKAEDTSSNATEVVVSDKTGFAAVHGTDNIAQYAASQKTGYRAIITATVKNAVTGAGITASDITSNDGEIGWSGGTGVFKLTKGSAARNAGNTGAAALSVGDLGAVIAATDSASAAGTFNISIKEGDYTYTAEQPLALYAVEDVLGYALIPTVTVSGGAEYFVDSATTVTMDTENLKNAALNYKLYKILDASADVSSPEDIKDSLKDGYIEDVTSKASFEIDYYKNGATPKVVPTASEFKITGSNGAYTANAYAKYPKIDVAVTATIDHQVFDNDDVSFVVNKSSAKVTVPFITNDSATVVTLPSAYLAGKTYSRGYDADPAHATNGYLFKVTAGTELTLPTAVEGLDAKRMLVGWKISAAADAIHGEGSALTNKYYMPGQKVVVDAAVTSVTAQYADKYTFSTVGLTFRENGEATENVTTYSLVDNVITPHTEKDVVVPDSTLGLNTSANAKFSVYADGDTLIGVGAKVSKTIQGTDVPATINVYPDAAATKTNSKVVWKAYDGATLPESTDAEKAAKAAAIDAVSVIDKTALATGKIKGLKAGTAQLFAVYVDENGNEYKSAETEITVEARPAYSVDFGADFPTEIEEGQTITTSGTKGLIISKSGSDITSTADGTIAWTLTGAGKVTLTESVTPVIEGVTRGEASVSVTYTDKNGVSVTCTAPKTITVKPRAVSINITDKNGSATTATPEVFASGGANTPTTLYVTVTNAQTGAYAVGGSLAAAKTGGDAVLTGGTEAFVDGATDTNIKQLKGTASATVGTEELTITYTAADGKKYTKTVNLKSYYTLTFDTTKAVEVSDIGGGATISDKTKIKITGTGGEADGNNYVVKLFKDDLDSSGEFSLDLAGFSATYSVAADGIDFAGWTAPDATTPVATTLAGVVTKLEGVTGENLLIAPQFKNVAISSFNVNSNSIVIDNLDAAAKQAVTIEVSASPISAADVRAKSSVVLADATDGFFYLNKGQAAGTGTVDDITIAPGTSATTVNKYYFTVASRADKIGEAKVTVSSVGSTATKDVNVKIYGQFADNSGNKYYRKADGTNAKDTAVTVNDVTRFYDEEEHLILKGRTGAATAHDEKGNLVLLTYTSLSTDPATVVTTDGFHASADSDGNDYYTVKGIVQTGLIDVSGVQRYADKKGVLITYAMTEKLGTPGKYTDPDTKITYVIDKDTNAAEQDDKRIVQGTPSFTWTPAKNKDYNHNTTTVKATVTVNYKLEKAGTTGKEELTAVLTSDKTQKGKDVYTATVTASGYYKDSKTEYDFSKLKDTKTYTYDPSSGQGKGEGFEISGIESSYPYTGKQIKPEPIVTDAATGAVLIKNTDYKVSYGTNKGPGEKAGSVIVKGNGNYGLDKNATVVTTFDIEDPKEGKDPSDLFLVKSVSVTSKDGFTYTGSEQFPKSLKIKSSSSDIIATWNGSDYDLSDTSKDVVITVTNNINKGTGVVAVTGADGKGGFVTKTATFSIGACDLSKAGDNLNISADPAEWSVKGAKANVEVTFMSETLVPGRDYTLGWSYSNKKNKGTGAGTVKVKGKGNFKSSKEQTFDITAFQINEIYSVDAYEGLAAKSVKVTVNDKEGNAIAAKNNYTVKIKKDGNDITTSSEKLKAGDELDITVEAISGSNVEGSATASVTVGAKLKSVKITVDKNFSKPFTGEEVTLDASDFGSGKIQVGSYTYGSDFKIVGYKNNFKKGNMTVTIEGIGGKVSGLATFKVKITPKSINPEN